MNDIVNLQSFKTEKTLRDNFWDPYFITSYYEADIPSIKKTKEEIGELFGLNYITRLIKSAKKKKTLLGKHCAKLGNIPLYITIQLDKMNPEEFQEAITILNSEIKKVKTSMKKDLMIIRNYMINKKSLLCRN